jgi:hypothetical protein
VTSPTPLSRRGTSMTEQAEKIASAERRLDDAQNLISCVDLASRELGGIADPIRAVANIAAEKIGEAVALLEQARDVAG